MPALKRAAATVAACALALGAAAAAADDPTPAQRRIDAARGAVALRPEPAAYNDLALALARRARETADPAFYDQARQALRRSLELAPGNFDARKTAVWVLLGQHEFARALDEARALNQEAPDDLQVYGLLVDANVELGRYDAAEDAAQWMLDLRPGNIPALTRAAYLRELFGDVEGALDLMAQAYRRTPPDEVEERAWILAQVAHLHLSVGAVERAEAACVEALQLFPDYHYALGQLARVRSAQRRFADAAALQQQRYRGAPHPENLYELARALERAGRKREAGDAYRQFERQARAEMAGADNANRELSDYYVEHAARPADGLRVAEAEFVRRQDLYTRAAVAWALSAVGRQRAAREAIDAALAVGVQDAVLYYRAGVIALRQGDGTAARAHLERSLRIDPASEVAERARRALAPSQAAAAR